MFHVSQGLFFNREEDGSVTVIKTKSGKLPSETTEDDILFRQTLDDGAWGSVISSVSAGGEHDLRWYAAMDFHKSKGEVRVVPAPLISAE